MRINGLSILAHASNVFFMLFCGFLSLFLGLVFLHKILWGISEPPQWTSIIGGQQVVIRVASEGLTDIPISVFAFLFSIGAAIAYFLTDNLRVSARETDNYRKRLEDLAEQIEEKELLGDVVYTNSRDLL